MIVLLEYFSKYQLYLNYEQAFITHQSGCLEQQKILKAPGYDDIKNSQPTITFTNLISSINSQGGVISLWTTINTVTTYFIGCC